MRVGFDLSPLAWPHPPGVARVARELTRELESRGGLEVVRLTPESPGPTRAWRHEQLPRAVAARGLDGLHSFVSAFAWRGPGLRVHTVHELPWRHGVRENAGWRHRLWARLGPRRADATVTPSRHVARELGRKLAGEGGSLHVVPWGVEPRFCVEPEPGQVDEVVLDRYALREGNFALCVGATRAKKNLAAVLRGLAARVASDRRDLSLVVTGPHTADLRRDLGLVSRLGLAGCVSTPGEVEDRHLPALLRLAAVVPVLSHSEGFGLPVAEALACGTPVLVPRASAQAEVAGEAGIAVDPTDPESVADGLERALAEREALRYQLPARVAHLTWARAAEAVEGLWKGLAR